jgi:hypothetical protein
MRLSDFEQDAGWRKRFFPFPKWYQHTERSPANQLEGGAL